MARAVTIPTDQPEAELTVGGKRVKLTNLDKLFWRESGITKRHLLQYYADVSPAYVDGMDAMPIDHRRRRSTSASTSLRPRRARIAAAP